MWCVMPFQLSIFVTLNNFSKRLFQFQRYIFIRMPSCGVLTYSCFFFNKSIRKVKNCCFLAPYVRYSPQSVLQCCSRKSTTLQFRIHNVNIIILKVLKEALKWQIIQSRNNEHAKQHTSLHTFKFNSHPRFHVCKRIFI